MVDVVSEIVVARPVADVAAYAGDPTNAPQWYENIRSVDWVTAPPARVGSKVAFVAKFLGRTLRNRGEPSGFSELVASMMAPAMRRANRKDLLRLKAVLEQARD